MKAETEKAKPAGLQANSSEKNLRGRPFVKGQSGNPSGKRKGSVSIAATLKRMLSKRDAEKICRSLIKQAMCGDLAAVKLLLDRMDGPLSGPLAISMLQTTINNTAREEVIYERPFKGVSSARLEQLLAAFAPELEQPAEPPPAPAPKPQPKPSSFDEACALVASAHSWDMQADWRKILDEVCSRWPELKEPEEQPSCEPAQQKDPSVLTGAEFLKL
jgi:hypothetical protein